MAIPSPKPSRSTAPTSSWVPSSRARRALQALDLQGESFSNIYQTDPVTGAFGSPSLSPINDGFYLFGQNMAFDGTYTYYNDGYGGTGLIFKLDSTGAVVAETTRAQQRPLRRPGLLERRALRERLVRRQHLHLRRQHPGLPGHDQYRLRPALVGLAGDPDAASSGRWRSLGSTGLLPRSTRPPAAVLKARERQRPGLLRAGPGLRQRGSDRLRHQRFSGAGNNFLDEYDPNTFAFVQRVDPPYTYAASGLAGDGSGRCQRRLVLVQRQRRRQPGHHHDHARRLERQRPAVRQRSRSRRSTSTTPAATWSPPRPATPPTAATTSSTGRRSPPGSYRVQILGASNDQPGRVHDQHPGRHRRRSPRSR